MISIKNLHKYFNKGKQNENHIINDVSLELPDKGMVAIFGKSGCGKTTLLNVIGGLDGFAAGSLTIDGKSIRKNTDDVRNAYIGYIFQNYNLNKQESCFENVADALRLCGMTDKEEIAARVDAALANVGLSKYRLRTPDTMSGGQQQRVAIARAIVKNPRIILADEPTGNLDEANTVMIMDLLKAIAKDHLVLLVTHESNLVDYYCDTVIEVSDGCVIDVRNNSAANGFSARDKNDIYLGELARTELKSENAEVEFYGDTPAEPVRLKIINSGGKLYVQIGTQRVHIIDESSEVKLREGVYEERANQHAVDSIDMSMLTPVNGKRFGRLFTFSSSIKSGFVANFKGRKKGKKLLTACMCLFAAVIVFMGAIFGTAIDDIINVQNSYNHNVFYVYTPSADVSEKLNSALGTADSAIDYAYLTYSRPKGDGKIAFRAGSFETFSDRLSETGIETNAVLLGLSLAQDKKLLAGKNDGLSENEVLISRKVAEALIEGSTLGYIKDFGDLIGLVSINYIGGAPARIAGVVDSDETAVYAHELTLARNVGNNAYFFLASDYGMEVKKGETVLVIKNARADVEYPKVGERIKINGVELKVSAIKRAIHDYSAWLEENGIEKLEEYAYFENIVKTEKPSLELDSEEFRRELELVRDIRYYEFYDYYYDKCDEFLRELYMFSPEDLNLWLYNDKGIEEVKFFYLSEDYYKAWQYKAQYGRYPSVKELESVYDSFNGFKELQHSLDNYYYEFKWDGRGYINSSAYLVSQEDFVAAAKQLGETHPSAKDQNFVMGYVPEKGGEGYFDDVVYYGSVAYTVLHSTDPASTNAWLEKEFASLTAPKGYNTILSPYAIFDGIIEQSVGEIVSSLIAMAVVLVLMCVCMYFIMRSSLMNRIKEVGVYRAIGVSKKNLAFKFFVEAMVLCALTVFVGYLLTSGFLYMAMGLSSLVEDLFFYPLWYAGAILAVIAAISLLFGTLPILSLLKKTPSEILAKYDI